MEDMERKHPTSRSRTRAMLAACLFGSLLVALGGCIPDSYTDCPDTGKGDIDITIDTEIKPDTGQETEFP